MTKSNDKAYFSMEYTSGTSVVWGKAVARRLGVVPRNVAAKFLEWVNAVKMVGLAKVRARPGFHDEPLKGERRGQRSIRLSRSYRAIYVETLSGTVELVEVIEVTKHEY